MIKLLRVDHRLLHGQVAFSWTSKLSADCILIASDAVMNDDLRKMSIKLAKPTGVKLVIKNIADAVNAINSGVTDKYKLFIVVESIKDAKAIAEACNIKAINLGGTKATSETRNISKAMNVTKEEEQMIRDMVSEGIKVDIQMVPTDKSLDALSAL